MILRPSVEDLTEERAYILDEFPELRAEWEGTLRDYKTRLRLAALRLTQIASLLREDATPSQPASED